MEFWQTVLDQLKSGKRVYLLTVIAHSGSTPGRTGFKMLVAEDGFISGSIGGGVMEFRLVEEAKALLNEGSSGNYCKRQVHSKDKNDASGMICSGEQTVAFVSLDLDRLSEVEEILDALERNKGCTIELSPTGLVLLDHTTVSGERFQSDLSGGEQWSYQERLGVKDSLYIVGAGHVSVAVSELFVSLGFHVTVLDDRENLNTLDLNTSAQQKLLVDYGKIDSYIPEGDSTYIAVMTNKFTDDRLVLSKLLRGDFRYVGVLGSSAKIEKMWEWLLKNGFTKEELDRVSGPIGMQIKSQTPMEIAVSIAAEVIALRNVSSELRLGS